MPIKFIVFITIFILLISIIFIVFSLINADLITNLQSISIDGFFKSFIYILYYGFFALIGLAIFVAFFYYLFDIDIFFMVIHIILIILLSPYFLLIAVSVLIKIIFNSKETRGIRAFGVIFVENDIFGVWKGLFGIYDLFILFMDSPFMKGVKSILQNKILI